MECIKHTKLALIIAPLFIGLAATTAEAAPYTLTNAPGGGTVTVGVDGMGAFGSSVGANSGNAVYDPVGAIGPAGTSFDSGVAIGFGGARTFLVGVGGDIGGSSTGVANPGVGGTPTLGTSTWTFGGIAWTLTQTLTPTFTGLTQTGSVLTQSYAMTNVGRTTLAFDLLRYLDGDLVFDGSITDGGGRLFTGTGLEVLFETDSATGSATSTTFVGITGEGGTIPVAGRYEVSSFAGLRDTIIAGGALGNLVSGDSGDADQFIDAGAGYDVTLALRNVFGLAPGASDTYTTRTFFGSGSPASILVPEPGTFALFGLGLGLLGFGVRRRRRKAAAPTA